MRYIENLHSGRNNNNNSNLRTSCGELSKFLDDGGHKGHYTLQWKSTYIEASGMFYV